MRNKKKTIATTSYSPQSMQSELQNTIQLLDTRIEASVYSLSVAEDESTRWSYRVNYARELLTRIQDETESAGIELLLRQAEKYADGYSKCVTEEDAILQELFAQEKQVKESLKPIALLVEKEAMIANLRSSTATDALDLKSTKRDEKERREIDVLISQAAGVIEAHTTS